MRTSRRTAGLVALVASTALVLTACGGGGGAGGGEGGGPADVSGDGTVSETNDINPVARDQIQQGGDLFWSVSEITPNFNYHHLDGTLADGRDVTDGIFPLIHKGDPQGVLVPDPDYLVSAEVTSEDPQVVTYEINPEASWSNGRAMDWTDFQAMWTALNGTNADYLVSGTTGFEDITSVEQGETPQQVVVTFGANFGDWRSLFSPFYPAEFMGTPEAFNTGLTEEVPVSGGPFQVESIDRTGQRLTSVPNPEWWGDPPLLDRIIYIALDPNAAPEAFANGTLSFFEIGPSVANLQRAQQVPDVSIRTSSGPNYRHITFNGAEGSILADAALRRAVQKGIDRQVITESQIGPIVPGATPLGNHVYVEGLAGYEDNSGVVAYNPDEARAELDALGWVEAGEGRARDGQELVIRTVIPSGVAVSEAEARIVQQQLSEIGVRVNIENVPVDVFFQDFVNTGNFDMTHFSWLGTTTPLSSGTGILRLVPDAVNQNYGRIGNDRINELLTEANAELDEERRRELANEIDREVWNEGHSLLLYQRPDAFATRADLANFGAKGFADYRYQDIGFVTP